MNAQGRESFVRPCMYLYGSPTNGIAKASSYGASLPDISRRRREMLTATLSNNNNNNNINLNHAKFAAHLATPEREYHGTACKPWAENKPAVVRHFAHNHSGASHDALSSTHVYSLEYLSSPGSESSHVD